MADQTWVANTNGKTTKTPLDGTEEVRIVDDPSGTPVSKKTTTADIAALASDARIPSTTTAGRLARFSGTDGTMEDTSAVSIDGSGNVVLPGTTTALIKWTNLNNTTSIAGLDWFSPGHWGTRLGVDPADGTVVIWNTASGSPVESIRFGYETKIPTIRADNINLGRTTSYGLSRIRGWYYGGNDAIAIATYNSSGNSQPDRMTFTTGDTAAIKISNARLAINVTTPTAPLDNGSDTYRQRTARTPASATDAGNTGDFCWDADYLYICIATNTWRRVAHATW